MSITGQLSGGAFTLTKAGPGTLELAGSSNNTGPTTGFTVRDGELLLNKAAGVQSILGAIIIGDEIGTASSARVTAMTAGQIAAAATFTVASDGKLDLSQITTGGYLGITPINEVQLVGWSGAFTNALGAIAQALSFAGFTTGGEVQTVTVDPGVTSFTLNFNGADSAVITRATADGAVVQAALQSIPTLATNVSVRGPAGGPYVVTYTNGQRAINQNNLTFTNVTGTLGASNVVQTFQGGNLAVDATAAQVQLALENLPSIGTGNVSVSGSAGQYYVTFQIALGNVNLPQITVSTLPAATAINTTVLEGTGNEIETLTLVTGGTFTPLWNTVAAAAALSATTGSSPTADALERNLNTIPALAGNVKVFGPDFGPFNIIFLNGLALTNVAQMVANVTAPTTATFATAATTPPSQGIGRDTQSLTITAAAGSSGGNLTLAFGGSQVDIPAASTPAQIQAALESLPTIGTGNVLVFGTANLNAISPVYNIVFRGALGNSNLPLFTTVALATGMTAPAAGAAATASVTDGTEFNEVQALVKSAAGPTAGTFTLQVPGFTTVRTYNYDATAATVKADLIANSGSPLFLTASNFDVVNGGNGLGAANSAGSYQFVFKGNLAGTHIDPLVVDNTGLTGGSFRSVIVADGAPAGNAVQQVVIHPALQSAPR